VILSKLGHDGLVAYAVLEYMTMSAVVTMVALVQSMQPMVSYYRGAGNRRAVRQSFQIGFWCVLVFSVLVAAELLLLSRPLTQLFLPDSLTAWTVLQGAVLWYALAFIPAGVNLAIAGYLTAIEAPGASSVIAVLRSWLLLLGLLWLLSELFGVSGIWFTLLGTELLTLAVSLWLYRRVAPSAYLRPTSTPSTKPMPAAAASVSHGRS
jgi:Na+-driven multidrug efflux pump